MTDDEFARLLSERAELRVENAALAANLARTPAEWARQARDAEAELGRFPDDEVELLCEAGHAWTQAGELDYAERCYRELATREDEPFMPDTRVHYGGFLLLHGDAARGQHLFDEIWSEHPPQPETYHVVAEALEAVERYDQALTWVNAGLGRCYLPPFAPDVEDVVDDCNLDDLLAARHRIRQVLDQSADELDALNRRVREYYQGLLEPSTLDAASAVVAVLFWPSAGFAEVTRRWPEAYTDLVVDADPHAEHRRQVEKVLRTAASGTTPVVVAGDPDGFAQFCAGQDCDPTAPASRSRYASELARRGHGAPWPPGRNDACWCRSGRKYKKCCGAPGFVDV